MLHLVDCSLLVPPRTGPDGRSRYSMLETLRSYGLERLREADEEHQAASALTVHAIHVAERAAVQMAVRDQEQSAALWLDAEDAAVHQALAWALDNDPGAALRLAVALAPWWLVPGRAGGSRDHGCFSAPSGRRTPAQALGTPPICGSAISRA